MPDTAGPSSSPAPVLPCTTAGCWAGRLAVEDRRAEAVPVAGVGCSRVVGALLGEEVVEQQGGVVCLGAGGFGFGAGEGGQELVAHVAHAFLAGDVPHVALEQVCEALRNVGAFSAGACAAHRCGIARRCDRGS